MEDDYVDCLYCHAASLTEEVVAQSGHCPVCGRANYELDGYMGHLGQRTASGGLDDLTQRRALNLVREWMHQRYGDEDSKDPAAPSGQRAYESGAGVKLDPSWTGSWQHPVTGEMVDDESGPSPAILHEGVPGWADEASFDDDLNDRLRGVGVQTGNWYGNVLTLHPHREWSIPPHARTSDHRDHTNRTGNTVNRRTADKAPSMPSNSDPAAPYQDAGQLGITGLDGGIPSDTPYSSLNIGGDGVSDGGGNQADGSARGPSGPFKIQVSDPQGPSIEHSNADPVGTLNGLDTGGKRFVDDPTGGIMSGPYLTDMAPAPQPSGGSYASGPSTPAPAQSGGGGFSDAPPKTSALRLAAIDFLAGQNTRDRDELLFRAHRHASDLTGRLPVPTAQRTVRAFVAAVHREIVAAGDPQDEACDDCGADAGEECRFYCTGKAKHDDEVAEGKRKKSRRTARVVADFPDELMF